MGVRTKGGKGGQGSGKEKVYVPGPLTFRMILRVVSSMNSTRTCVTPPREPIMEWDVSNCVCLRRVAFRKPPKQSSIVVGCSLFASHWGGGGRCSKRE